MLASISAISELFGTWTVWNTYQKSVKVARLVLQTIAKQESEDVSDASTTWTRAMHGLTDTTNSDRLQKIKDQNREALYVIVEPLQVSRLATAGLIAYFTGAVFGLAAAVVAIS